MPAEPIRIRITQRDREPTSGNPREDFWSVVRGQSDSNQTIAGFEAKLCREFGPEPRRALLSELTAPLRTLDSELFPGSLSDLEHWMFRFINGPSSEREWFRYQFADVFSRLLEQRLQLMRESPGLRSVQERLAAAAAVTFSTRIAGYSSLGLDLSAGSFTHLAKAFDNDFDSFRVFLEAFVPVAFAGVFSEDSAARFDFAVSVPASAEQAFRVASAAPQATPATAPSSPANPAAARERAEWLWRLANGSLLIPVLLVLLVMYQGMKMLTEIRAAQHDAVKPILEHQLKLLEEDRQRLFRTPQPSQTPSPSPSSPRQ